MRVRLYVCKNGHQFETAEAVVGDVTEIRRAKNMINKVTVKREARAWRANDYSL